jgi:hypothetical protein
MTLRLRPVLVCAVALATLPIWTLPIALVGIPGFQWYLAISNAYYTLARSVFGHTLFPVEEFGVIPLGAIGPIVAALLYAVIGAAFGLLLSLAWPRRRDVDRSGLK